METSQIEHPRISNAGAAADIVLVCEHASNFIPDEFGDLGLADEAKTSHAAWDPGALPVAEALSAQLDATLIAGGVSRLVYDCNRPPEAPDAMPAQSEAIVVPGNAKLTPAKRKDRAKRYYTPFEKGLSRAIAGKYAPILVTIHSFTPVYNGTPREVEIGILHSADDSRLADAMLDTAEQHSEHRIARNQPYGPEDSVMHTLQVHAVPSGDANVMIELRNDLIAKPDDQQAMAEMLADWLRDAVDRLDYGGSAG